MARTAHDRGRSRTVDLRRSVSRTTAGVGRPGRPGVAEAAVLVLVARARRRPGIVEAKATVAARAAERMRVVLSRLERLAAKRVAGRRPEVAASVADAGVEAPADVGLPARCVRRAAIRGPSVARRRALPEVGGDGSRAADALDRLDGFVAPACSAVPRRAVRCGRRRHVRRNGRSLLAGAVAAHEVAVAVVVAIARMRRVTVATLRPFRMEASEGGEQDERRDRSPDEWTHRSCRSTARAAGRGACHRGFARAPPVSAIHTVQIAAHATERGPRMLGA